MTGDIPSPGPQFRATEPPVKPAEIVVELSPVPLMERWERELLDLLRDLQKNERQAKLVIEFDRDGNWRIFKSVPVAKCCV